MRSLAAVEYVRAHPEVQSIMFSGGKTRGAHRPSEAEVMRDYFLKTWQLQERRMGIDAEHARDFSLHLEEHSCDTEGNAEHTMRLLQEQYGGAVRDILLLTDATHMPRAVAAFERHGANVTEGVVTELSVSGRSPHHRAYVRRRMLSWKFLKRTIFIEPISSLLDATSW